ncbi:MAG TPA: hypothetical protein VJ777_18485 [Mycobacterium sp.]|nr:hypothetical protein [Mycobacterium sp.]
MPLPANPLPTPGIFPDWYKGGFIDIERLLMDWFGGLFTDAVTCLTWFPPENEVLENIANGLIYLRIFRSGGRIVFNEDGGTGVLDRPHVQFAAMSRSRDLSWEVIEFVRNMLYPFNVGGGGGRMITDFGYAAITVNGEVMGPSITPDVFRDQRLVPITFELEVERRKGLPTFSNYGAELGL